MHIRKVKDTDTGGRPTSLDDPVKLKSIKNCSTLNPKGEKACFASSNLPLFPVINHSCITICKTIRLMNKPIIE